jgi:photosystem II stability/assembly factor-like uncharacterized protein
MKNNWVILKYLFILFCFSSLICPLVYAETPGETIKPGDIHENIYDGMMLSHDIYIMVGERGKIYRSTDAGESWKVMPSGTHQPLFSVSFGDDRNGWISGNGGLILHTKDGGKTWVKQDSSTKKDLLSIHFADARMGAAVGDWGAIVRTENGGGTWEDVSLADDVVLYGVKMIDGMTGYLTGEFGIVFKTEDGGKTWQSLLDERDTSLEPQSLFCLTEDKGTLFFGGMDGKIIYSEDKGQNWVRSRNDLKQSIYGIAVKGNNGWAVGDLGAVLFSTDRGKTWNQVELPLQFKLSWICAVDSMNSDAVSGFAAGSKGLFLKIKNNAMAWK